MTTKKKKTVENIWGILPSIKNSEEYDPFNPPYNSFFSGCPFTNKF
jgi:hypothetical protein